jgi:hypothetical protein
MEHYDMSYKVEVQADSSGTWAGNSLRFADRAEAQAYGRDLEGRWFAVRALRVVESVDAVSHVWRDGRAAIANTCCYCDSYEPGLRVYSRGPSAGMVTWICEDCFTPRDTGPCFDDLEARI